jgi:hypothetical protein
MAMQLGAAPAQRAGVRKGKIMRNVFISAVAAAAVFLGLSAGASAGTLGITPTNNPIIEAAAPSVSGSLAFGVIDLAGDDLSQTLFNGGLIGPTLDSFTISGLLAGPVLLNVFETAGAAAPVLQGELLTSSLDGERLEFLFSNTGVGSSAALNAAFGNRILVMLDVERMDVAGVSTFLGGQGVITTPIPLPAAAPLFLAALVGLGAMARRRAA